MILKICCPNCGVKLKIRPHMLGRKGKCPQCGQRLRVEPRGYIVKAVIGATAVAPVADPLPPESTPSPEITNHP